MLQSLHIKDFILIDKLDLDFSEGFNVITGETGAGKSILLDSILFCFGEKISGNPIKALSESCSVTTVFSSSETIKSFLDNFETECTEELILKCTQNTQGRKKFFLNDQIVSLKLVQEMFNYVFEIHGQHNHTLLLNASSHIEILDAFGNLQQLRKDVSQKYKNTKELEEKLKEFNSKKEQNKLEMNYLSHICLELENANIKQGEEEQLLDVKRKLVSQSKEINLIKALVFDIEESDIERLIIKLEKAISQSNLLDNISTDLSIVYDKIENIKSTLQQILYDVETPEFSLEEIEDRIYEIRSLARKHSCSSDELGEFAKSSKLKLQELESEMISSSELEEKYIAAREEYFISAEYLSANRQKNASILEQKVMQELLVLGMKKAIFKVKIDSQKDFISIKGVDKINFIASTNPGTVLSAIDKTASGGELSRFMLALRVSLFDTAPKQTIIFDEIDVGISGAIADSIGERLKELSKAVQIIAITHQPQVAGKANTHILVEKIQHEDHTIVRVKNLETQEKTYEIARMISGREITKVGIKAAKELLPG